MKSRRISVQHRHMKTGDVQLTGHEDDWNVSNLIEMAIKRGLHRIREHDDLYRVIGWQKDAVMTDLVGRVEKWNEQIR